MANQIVELPLDFYEFFVDVAANATSVCMYMAHGFSCQHSYYSQADPLGFSPSVAASPFGAPELRTCSTTVLNELQCPHWIPKKCQFRAWLLVSQSLHIMSTTLCKSAGMGCSAISLARASQAAAMDCCETTVFLQMGQR